MSLVLGSLGKIRNPDLREKLVYYGFYDTKRGSVVHGGRGYHIYIYIYIYFFFFDISILTPKYLNRDYMKAKVYTSGVHAHFGGCRECRFGTRLPLPARISARKGSKGTAPVATVQPKGSQVLL